MNAFIYNAYAARVVFGAGSLKHLEREIDALGYKRALVLSTPEQRASAQMVADLLGARAAGVFDRAVMHVPIETAREAREVARQLGADCAVAIGGGSTTGLGKAIALDSGLPIIAIPTTYAGSEMTPVYGITEGGLKKTGKDAKVVPRAVIYDPELTLSLPPAMSLTSGINAIAHSAEGLYSADRNPVIDFMARDGIAALGRFDGPGQGLGSVFFQSLFTKVIGFCQSGAGGEVSLLGCFRDPGNRARHIPGGSQALDLHQTEVEPGRCNPGLGRLG
jgi:alcohol dehydrogenase class IV